MKISWFAWTGFCGCAAMAAKDVVLHNPWSAALNIFFALMNLGLAIDAKHGGSP